MEKPLVSVIIPNHNYVRYLPDAIASVLAQTYRNIEIIVVDDGSEDDSIEILKRFGKQTKILRQNNQGVSAARNNGVDMSKGEFIAFLDADDVWMPEKVEKQIERFFTDMKLGLVHVGVEDIDAEGRSLKTHLDGLEGSVSEDLLLFKRSVVLGGGSGMMIPRRVFEEIGKFDVRLSTSGDWDVFYQIAKRYQIGFVPEILLKYRVHGSNMHGNISRMEREMLLAYEKVFAEKDEKLQKLRRTAYSNLHKVLAGSYFRCGNYWYFARNVVKSIRFKPRNISYFAKFPIRILQRKFKNSQ